MISLSEFQPLCIAKVNIFYQQLRFYRQIHHSVKVQSQNAITIHAYTLHAWSTLVAFKTKFDLMTNNDLHVKLKPAVKVF